MLPSTLICSLLFFNDSFIHRFGVAAAEDDELGPDGKKVRTGITSSIITELTDCNAALSQQRKKRQVSIALILKEVIA